MKLKIYKEIENEKEEVIIKIIEGHEEKDFDYILLIEFLYYDENKKVDFDFGENVTEKEREKIQELFEQIKSKFLPSQKENNLKITYA